MINSIEVEIREQAGREPTLHGIMLQEGRAASGGRRELFAPGAIEWPSEGVAILTQHRGEIESRGHVVRQRDGRLVLTARATEGIQRAVAAGKRFMSVEFKTLRERVTKGGIREIQRAFVDSAALVDRPEYDMTSAEVRGEGLAALLRAERDRAGVSNAAIAAAGGIDESTFGGILQGDSGINCPPLNRLRGFASALGIPSQRLIDAAEADGCEYASESERARLWL